MSLSSAVPEFRVVLFRHCMIETKDAPQIACPSSIHYIQIRERLDAQDDSSTHVSTEGHELRSKSAGEIAIAVVVDAQKDDVAPQLEEDEVRGE